MTKVSAIAAQAAVPACSGVTSINSAKSETPASAAIVSSWPGSIQTRFTRTSRSSPPDRVDDPDQDCGGNRETHLQAHLRADASVRAQSERVRDIEYHLVRPRRLTSAGDDARYGSDERAAKHDDEVARIFQHDWNVLQK